MIDGVSIPSEELPMNDRAPVPVPPVPPLPPDVRASVDRLIAIAKVPTR
jgi:hypothetical protein